MRGQVEQYIARIQAWSQTPTSLVYAAFTTRHLLGLNDRKSLLENGASKNACNVWQTAAELAKQIGLMKSQRLFLAKLNL